LYGLTLLPFQQLISSLQNQDGMQFGWDTQEAMSHLSHPECTNHPSPSTQSREIGEMVEGSVNRMLLLGEFRRISCLDLVETSIGIQIARRDSWLLLARFMLSLSLI
jgi:hypothetical protein